MNKSILLILTMFSVFYSWESTKIYIPSKKLYDDLSVYTGLDVLEISEFNEIKNKNIGLLINQTSVNRQKKNIIDIFYNNDDIKIKKIFTPEHGLNGKFNAGEFVDSDIDKEKNIDIISLYGKNKKPNASDLVDLDLIIYDIQDIGSRFYTYISTMTYMMEACAEQNIKMIILDRPNLLGGNYIKGPLLNVNYSSFVGMHPIPIIHGMTSGELAIMINESKWIAEKVDLTIIPIINWKRNTTIENTNLIWTKPSPNIVDYETVKLYAGLCLLEGTNISEGRGTQDPFKIFGAPFISSEDLLSSGNNLKYFGINLKKIDFIPTSIFEMAKWPKLKDEKCFGLKLEIEKKDYDVLKFTVNLMVLLNDLYPNKFKFLESNFIDNLYGSDKLRKTIINKENINNLFKDWENDEEYFKKKRAKFLIYD
ncbi:MAG: DUF1343 domain-containing protein [Candidatus Neomarinimicrobiota bacterium]|nr:DUF1343 domain-containing protein [Candidatus Neomarinimicrobiota bacterium]